MECLSDCAWPISGSRAGARINTPRYEQDVPSPEERESPPFAAVEAARNDGFTDIAMMVIAA